MTDLCKLFIKYKADKYGFHSYSDQYFDLLNFFKDKYKNILEIGVGTKEVMRDISGESYVPGASLRAWRDYFLNANIFGLDIEKTVLFSEDRIKCFYTDQSNAEELHKSINEIKINTNDSNLKFDLIIDDGSHIPVHMINSFNTLKEYLNINGIYIIEDILRSDLKLFCNLSDSDNFKLIKTYSGKWDQDIFVAYQKLK